MRRRGVRLLCLAAYLLLRLSLASLDGYEDDLKSYRHWALAAARHGVASVYRDADMDYPPLYAYYLAPLGRLYDGLVPEAQVSPRKGDPDLWRQLVKLPPLLHDLGIAFLLYGCGRRAGGRWEWILPASYLLNPAVLFDSGYWGQPDSIHSSFVLAAFLSLPGRRAWPAWMLLTLATLMKPLAAPFFPLLLVLSLTWHGAAATALGVAASGLTALAVFAPFLATGEGPDILRRLLTDLGRMPFASVNAHNLWWLVAPWRNAETAWLGPLTPTHLGLVLFGAVYVILLLQAGRLKDDSGGSRESQSLALAVAVGFSFFMLATHMHENHLFVVIPLVIPLVAIGRPWPALFIGLTVAVTVNLVLHDPAIPGLWPFTLGGPTSVFRPSHGRPFFVVEFLLTQIATVFTVALYVLVLSRVLRSRRSGVPSWG